MKQSFKIPVSWEVYGVVRINADSIEEAINIFDETEDEIPLLEDWYYVDGSFERGDLETCKLQNDIK